jgi:endoglucanase
MWSPAGNNNTQDYYPGGEYVDMIGLTVLVSEDWDRLYGNDKPWPEPMAQVFYIRYERVSGYKKPVMIAELGVSYSDPVVDRTPWLTAGFKSVNQEKYPLYVGWVFFNEQNQANKHVAILPDFRVTRDELLNALDLSGGR